MQVKMHSGNRFIVCTIIFWIQLFLTPVKAQVLQDSTSINLVKRGVRYIYNLQFGDAENILNTLNHKYPGHTSVHLFRGMLIYWENYPLLPTSPASKSFEAEMRESINLCESDKTHTFEAENLLMNLCARGLLLLFFSENDMSNDVLPLAASTYKYIKQSFRFTSVFADFNYFTGLYNYYREAYPENHPVYRAFAFLFPAGDKKKGLIELQNCADNSIVLGAEAFSILSWINMHYENDYKKALGYIETLLERYPSNLLYKGEYIKNLILIKQYDTAEELINSSDRDKNSYYQSQLKIFKGLLQEKKYRNFTFASEYYKQGIRDMSAYGPYGDEFAAYGYFGLDRINVLSGGKQKKRPFPRKSKDLVKYENVNFDD